MKLNEARAKEILGYNAEENEVTCCMVGYDAAAAVTELLRKALELVLIFHDTWPWDDAKRKEWNKRMDALLGPVDTRDPKVVGAHGDGTWDGARPSNEATTKNLCNAVRAALAK